MMDLDAAWNAVSARERSLDGTLFFAVRTTGIYCRPSCPSRRPRRENVTFYETPDAAEQAGFRPCLRCEPRSAGGTPSERAVRDALSHLEERLDENVTLAQLGEAVGMSPHHLQRTFREHVGVSPRAWREARRAERLRDGLRAGASVADATYEAGFGSARAVYQRRGGVTPGALRRKGQGLRMRFTIAPCPMGRLLVAATDGGVCAVAVGEDDAALESGLRRDFSRASIERDDAALAERVAGVVRYLQGSQPGLALPLDLHGTAFQVRVWQALRDIPCGETRSYAEVAKAVGRPEAVRAVAAAVAANPVAFAVPCHRVIHADGTLSGYRWGPANKRALLDMESDPGPG